MSIACHPLVVQKYGGLSLNTPARMKSAIEHMRQWISQGWKIVAVVSAMGRAGDPYATDTLLQLVESESCKVDEREMDLLMSCGELIAMANFSQRLRQTGISASGRSGWEAGIITDSEHGNAKVQQVLTRRLLQDLEEHDVVVVAGFQGMSETGEIHCLGRGGSDTSAVAIAIGLQADRLEIIKDVDGVYTADPLLVPAAQKLSVVSAADLREMAWLGARVLHPRAAELAERHGIAINFIKLDGSQGTTVVPEQILESRRFITGVTVVSPVSQVQLQLSEIEWQKEMATLFQEIANAGISMDMFSIMNHHVWFTVAQSAVGRLQALLVGTKTSFQIRDAMAKVSIVGSGMHGIPGVMAQFCQVLTDQNIAIVQTADSHATISALVTATSAPPAVRALHKHFIES